jgi:hypothetical protein
MNDDIWGDRESRWKDPAYLKWLNEIWHVRIKEEPRHLWPGQWTIHGYWEDEERLYKKYEKIWEDRRQEAWDKKHPKRALDDVMSLQELAEGITLDIGGEDYFHWNVQTPGWSMHRNGTWQKMLVDMNEWLDNARKAPGQLNKREDYPGIYNSYEHACKTLANYCDLLAPRFALGELTDYEKHLKDFVEKLQLKIIKNSVFLRSMFSYCVTQNGINAKNLRSNLGKLRMVLRRTLALVNLLLGRLM